MNHPNTTTEVTHQALLTLIMPPDLADPLTDWLLEQPEISGFISLPVNGHGGEEHCMTPAERVAGYRKNQMFQTHLSLEHAQTVLDRLKHAFNGSDIHFWLSPLFASGHLA